MHRLTWLGCGLLFALACPPYSELGRPAEPLCFGSALLLGEVTGHPPSPCHAPGPEGLTLTDPYP